MSGALDGKVVAVVGATGCYGAAAARALATEGASLVLGARSRESLEKLQRELEESGAQTLAVGTDVSRYRHLERLVEVALESFGSLDALVYAAHVSPDSLESFDIRSWGDCVDVNVRGFLYAAGAAIPAILERGGGHVLDLAAGSGDGALERAARSARRKVREGLQAEFYGRGARMSEVITGPNSAKEVCRLLASNGG